MDKVYEYLKKAGTFFYATAETNGQPRVRPFGFFMKYEDKLYFGMGQQKPSFAQTRANPKFEICAYIPAEMSWVRIEGTAVFDDRAVVTEAAFTDSPQLKGLYNEQTGNVLGHFYIKDATATFSSFAGEPEVVKF
ncbi:MAG: pyridoxamine 5'-phosphate oxidase family protein [Oscillospiraceae bacterium]|jgi:uncharacterized pyridoxamine 5'-phosphate oxidase family protein|nr:pyridoxamine 5'-phosphate oxidase family protein [Oscillospiraceae bacterium]